MFAIMIRVIRAIRSLVDSVFVQKYVIEVYVSMSFCLREIRVIRRLVDSVFNKNMSLKHMSLCHSVSCLILSVKCFHSRQISWAQIASELTAFWLAKGAL